MMPENQYEQLNDSVLAWKKRQRLGRFDPTAKSAAELASERRVKDATDCGDERYQGGDEM